MIWTLLSSSLSLYIYILFILTHSQKYSLHTQPYLPGVISKMMVGSAVSIHDGKLSVLGMTTILSDVDEKVVLTPNISGNGAVLGVVSAACGGGCSHCVFPIGKLQCVK